MRVLKNLVAGTAVERPTRIIYKFIAERFRRAPRVTEWDLRDARDNAYVRALFRHRLQPNSCCIDVGAHAGFFLTQFLEFAPHGRHWAFEPIPPLAQALKITFPQVEVLNIALADKDGMSNFQYVPEFPGWSGLRQQPYPGKATPQITTVETRRLDSVIPTDERVDFIKIDVEGAELEVLRGAVEILLRYRPVIYFECAKLHHMHYTTTPESIHDFFGSCGMGIFLLDESGPLTAAQFADVYQRSHDSNYDRTAWGNYLALAIQ